MADKIGIIGAGHLAAMLAISYPARTALSLICDWSTLTSFLTVIRIQVRREQ